jgi:hypothetical protein
MIQHNLVKIGDLYLTRDGLVGGQRAATRVTGLDRLYCGALGASRRNADGSKVLQLIEDPPGVEITIEFEWIETATMDAVKTLLTQFIADGLPVSLDVTGETGDYTGLSVIFDWRPVPIEFGEFYFEGLVDEARIHLATA